jgi:hypothetical protein
MTPLHPKQLAVMRIRAAIVAAVMAALVLIADSALLSRTGFPVGIATAAAIVVLGAWTMVMPRRRYRSWGYDMREDELHVQHGLWVRDHTVVPFGRVQHIDVTQGPLERRFGLGTLILHTAGTRSSAVELPGLAFEDAGRMRDAIREQIRQDLA